jgi:hypothetical protein
MGWTRPKQEIFIDDPGYPETAGKSVLSLCRPELWHFETVG